MTSTYGRSVGNTFGKMKQGIAITLGAAFPLCVAWACGSEEPVGPGPESQQPAVIRSSRARLSATPSADALTGVVDGNAEFALDLYAELRQAPGNIVYSPFSMSLAMAMVWAGSGGQTEQEIASVFHFTGAPADVHEAFNALDARLESSSSGVTLHLANSLWLRPDSGPKAPFLDTLAENYGAGVHVVDLTNGDVAAPAINGWVSTETRGKIDQLVSRSDFDSRTRLALANALYFGGKWVDGFYPSGTFPADFIRSDGSTVRVPTMSGTFFTKYSEGSDYQATTFSYAGTPQTSFMVILPATDAFDSFEASFDGAKLDRIVAGLADRIVDVTLPRFSFRFDTNLRDALTALGMGREFTDVGTDFTPMADLAPNRISKVAHASTLSVDEQGTEASAATVVVLSKDASISAGPPSPPAVFQVDRPFLFAVRDDATGLLLFCGRVADPTAG